MGENGGTGPPTLQLGEGVDQPEGSQADAQKDPPIWWVAPDYLNPGPTRTDFLLEHMSRGNAEELQARLQSGEGERGDAIPNSIAMPEYLRTLNPAAGVNRSNWDLVQATPMAANASDAVNWLQHIMFEDPQRYDYMRTLMVASHVMTEEETMDPQKVVAAWTDVIRQTVAANSAGVNVTPFELLANNAKLYGTSIDPNVKEGAGTKTSSTSTRISTQLDSPSDIREAARPQAGQALGRELRGGEDAALVALIRDLERRDPDKTTETYTSTQNASGGSDSVSNQITEGGFNPNEAIHDYLTEAPDYGEYQAATTYWGALMNALAATNNAGA